MEEIYTDFYDKRLLSDTMLCISYEIIFVDSALKTWLILALIIALFY